MIVTLAANVNASTSNSPSSRTNFIRLSAGEVARRVVEEHVLRARVGRVDPVRVRARVPVVDRGVVLDPGVAAQVGRLGHLAEDVAGLVRAGRLAVGDLVGLPVRVALDGLHELVGHAHAVVRVLEEDAAVGLAGEARVVALLDQGPGLPLLVGLAVDELDDVGMVGVEDDHLGRAAGLAARLDHARERVVAAHEGDGAAGDAAAGHPGLRRAGWSTG